jgi:DNA-directed RNA polymerase specialized sigma24 family protein
VNPKVLQDQQRVERCLAGEVSAWSGLYQQFHHSLLEGIRAFLGNAGNDANLVEEIAARVWYALVKNDFELLARFDAQRGCRFSTFLSMVAKNEARLLLRSEKRRKARELAASKEVELSSQGGNLTSFPGEEFAATLSPTERTFFFEVLVADPGDSNASDYSQQNQWQLRHRIRKKLERFIFEHSETDGGESLSPVGTPVLRGSCSSSAEQ